jgi:leucyl-tRNA synthetase
MLCLASLLPVKSKSNPSVDSQKAYHIGEKVLVESKSGLIWDATVTAQSKRRSSDGGEDLLVDAYRVEYKEWGSRFVEWVQPSRVVEPNDHNRSLQVSVYLLCLTGKFDSTCRNADLFHT